MSLILCVDNRLDNLETLSQTYSDNITTIGIWVGIAIAIMGFITFFFGYLEPTKVLKEVNEIKGSLNNYNQKIAVLDEMITRQNELEGMVLRSLYDGADSNNFWKFIWSIRYCHWFYKNGFEDGLKIRITQALKDFDNATNKEHLKTFENSGRLKDQLRDLESSGNKEISDTARQIIKKYYAILD